ncbi:MAG: hypothetical protein R3C68_15470 [Myxococcota bacterium]
MSKGKVAQVLAGITQYKKDHPEVKISFTTESGWFKDTINIKFEGSAEAVLAASKSVDKMKNA